MRTEIAPGQTSDYLGFDLVMADNLPEPSVLLAPSHTCKHVLSGNGQRL